MTMKKRDNLIAVAFLAFILILPTVTLIRGFLPNEENEITEEQNEILNANGTLQENTQETTSEENGQNIQNEIKQPFFTRLQNTLNDFTNGLYARTKLIALNTELTSLLTGGSYIESTQVLLGKKDWLFYKSELDGHPIWDYMGINHFTEEELALMAENLIHL